MHASLLLYYGMGVQNGALGTGLEYTSFDCLIKRMKNKLITDFIQKRANLSCGPAGGYNINLMIIIPSAKQARIIEIIILMDIRKRFWEKKLSCESVGYVKLSRMV